MAELTFDIKTVIMDASGKASASLAVKGVVKDGSDLVLKQAAEQINGDRLVIDCGGLDSMSSIGAANWLRFIAEIRQRFARGICYERCPIFFVDYLNMFDAFRQDVEIGSIEVPYACAVCGYQGTSFIETARLDPRHPLPDIDCPKCGAVMQSQVAAEDYLAFMGD